MPELLSEEEVKGFSGVHEGRTKFIRKTIRSGQHINYQGNIVIIGDINSGAEVYATGNIITISPDDYEKPEYPEIAKVNNGTIIVEPYISNKYF